MYGGQFGPAGIAKTDRLEIQPADGRLGQRHGRHGLPDFGSLCKQIADTSRSPGRAHEVAINFRKRSKRTGNQRRR